jgi:signal transduction histidine kinase
MRFGRLTRAPRRVLILFLTVTVAPVAALAWLSWSLLEQDQELETKRLQDALEHAADVVAAALERRVSKATDQILALDNTGHMPDDAVVVVFGPKSVEAYPSGRLLYYPMVSSFGRDVSFPEGDLLEYQRQDFSGAIALFRQLSQSRDPDVRSAALLRLATNYRNNNQLEDALTIYRELQSLGPIAARDGTPVDFLARQQQCALLAKLGRATEWLQAARALNTDFENGRWVLDHGSYGDYLERAPQLFPADAQPRTPPPEKLALAESVEQLWAEWHGGGQNHLVEPGRRSLWINDRPVLALWKPAGSNLTAIVAGRQFIESQWGSAWRENGVTIALTDDEGNKVLGDGFDARIKTGERLAAKTGLPWTIRVASATPEADSAAMKKRHRLLWMGLTLMAVLTLLGGSFTIRAAAREFAIARVQSDFVSAVSHEFRTPLTTLRHMTELLSTGSVGEDRRRQYYAVMTRETERLQRLVEGLLAFGRMEAAGADHGFESIDPVELTHNAVAEFQSGARRIELTTNGVKPQSTTIRANPEAFSRAIRNLLENAIKYSPESSEVQVDLSRQGDRLAIRVHDGGFGIPVEEQKRIFDKFVRGAAAKALNVPGTGIGLAMTHHIVHAHGGEIQLESEPGRGTTFTILLPVSNL